MLKHPRRLEELLDMLSDKDIGVRGRSAAALARLAASKPERLIKVMPRLRDSLRDESDYVRWHLVYAFGEICFGLSAPALPYWSEVFAAMNDRCRVARIFATKAVARLSAKYPATMETFMRNQQTAPPEKNAGPGPQPVTGPGTKAPA